MDGIFGPYSRVKHEYCIRKLGRISHKIQMSIEQIMVFGKRMGNIWIISSMKIIRF